MMAIIRLFSHPIGAVLIGCMFTVVMGLALWHGGKWVGYHEGVAAQMAEQAKADKEQGEVIRERVKDAIDQMGVNISDDDVDDILRGLAGQ